MPDEDQQALRKSQREWLRLRDGHCDLETKNTREGTVWNQLDKECRTRLTQARTIDVEFLLQYR